MSAAASAPRAESYPASPPSARSLEVAMSIAMEAVSRLEAEGVDTDEDELRILLADMNADVESLLVCLLRAADEAEGTMEAIAARQNDLATRKARMSRQREACRGAALSIIEALPTVFPGGKYKGAEYSASVRPGLPSPIVTDEALLPDQCWQVTRKASMSAIRDLLKSGAVPGVALSNAAPVITVRTR